MVRTVAHTTRSACISVLLLSSAATAVAADDLCSVSPSNPGMMRYQVSLGTSLREALRLEAARTSEKEKLAQWIRQHLPDYQVMTEEQRSRIIYSPGICNATYTLSLHLTRQLNAIRMAIPACEPLPAHTAMLKKQEKSTEAVFYTLASSLMFCEKAGVKMHVVEPRSAKSQVAPAPLPTRVPPRTMLTNADVRSPVTNDKLLSAGDEQRSAIMARMIVATWKAHCKPDQVTGSRESHGAGLWQVHCTGSPLKFDYSVSVPVDLSRNARVLKCWQGQGGPLTCDLFGSPASRAIPGQLGAAHP